MTDLLHAFALPRLNVRGAAVRLTDGFQQILSHQPYPPSVRTWLGEALCAATLLITGLKFQGRLSVQLQGGAELALLYVECSSNGDCRGIARIAEGASPQEFEVATRGAAMAVTLEPLQGERYQGIVELQGATLAECFENYFARSEQLPTRMLLCADDAQAAGLMVQKLPESGGIGSIDRDGWNRCEHLVSTVDPGEMLSISSEQLLHRLFHQEERFDRTPLPLHIRCRCSRDKVSDVLRRLGRDEAIAAAREPGGAQITCEFCGKVYRFDAIEIEGLFRPIAPGAGRA